MGWKYNAGLGLIGAFVFIWVASAEVTQVIKAFSFALFLFLFGGIIEFSLGLFCVLMLLFYS